MRELAESETLSEVEVFWSDDESTGIDVWKVIMNPNRPGFFCFWFDRAEEVGAEFAPGEYIPIGLREEEQPAEEAVPWKTKK